MDGQLHMHNTNMSIRKKFLKNCGRAIIKYLLLLSMLGNVKSYFMDHEDKITMALLQMFFLFMPSGPIHVAMAQRLGNTTKNNYRIT